MKVSRLFWIGMIFVISGIAFIGGLMYLQEISFRKSILEHFLVKMWVIYYIHMNLYMSWDSFLK